MEYWICCIIGVLIGGLSTAVVFSRRELQLKKTLDQVAFSYLYMLTEFLATPGVIYLLYVHGKTNLVRRLLPNVCDIGEPPSEWPVATDTEYIRNPVKR